MGGPIHSIGNPLSDNIFYVAGSEGHAVTTTHGTVLVLARGEIFFPVNEALQILSTVYPTFETVLDDILSGCDDGGSGPSPIDGTPGNDTLSGRSDANLIEGLGDDDLLIGGDGDDDLRGQVGSDLPDGNGGKAEAIVYTLIETAKLHGVYTLARLTWLLALVANHKITRLGEQLPRRYAARAA